MTPQADSFNARSGNSPTIAERFYALFAGYGKAHGTYDARKLVRDPNSGKLKPECVLIKTGPSVPLWTAHLGGEKSLGVIPQTEGNCVGAASTWTTTKISTLQPSFTIRTTS